MATKTEPGKVFSNGSDAFNQRFLIAVFSIAFAGMVFLPACSKNEFYNYAFNLNGVAENGYNYSARYHYDTIARLREFAAEFYIGATANNNYAQVSFAGANNIPPGVYYNGFTYNGIICSFAYNNDTVNYPSISGILQVNAIDTVNHKIAGSFAFTAVNSSNYHDTVNITTGAFTGILYTTQ